MGKPERLFLAPTAEAATVARLVRTRLGCTAVDIMMGWRNGRCGLGDPNLRRVYRWDEEEVDVCAMVTCSRCCPLSWGTQFFFSSSAARLHGLHSDDYSHLVLRSIQCFIPILTGQAVKQTCEDYFVVQDSEGGQRRLGFDGM